MKIFPNFIRHHLITHTNIYNVVRTQPSTTSRKGVNGRLENISVSEKWSHRRSLIPHRSSVMNHRSSVMNIEKNKPTINWTDFDYEVGDPLGPTPPGDRHDSGGLL